MRPIHCRASLQSGWSHVDRAIDPPEPLSVPVPAVRPAPRLQRPDWAIFFKRLNAAASRIAAPIDRIIAPLAPMLTALEAFGKVTRLRGGARRLAHDR